MESYQSIKQRHQIESYFQDFEKQASNTNNKEKLLVSVQESEKCCQSKDNMNSGEKYDSKTVKWFQHFC